MVVVRKSQIVSLILTKDRDFKTRTVNFLNGVAFHAEKISGEDLESAKLQIAGRKEVMNLIIDGQSIGLKPEEIFKFAVEEGKQRPGLMTLIYFPEETCEKLKFLEKCPEYVLCRDLPFDKIHFNDCFHGRGKSGGAFNAFQGAHQPLDMTAKKIDKAQDAKKPNVIAFEASSHVRDTIEKLNAIKANRGDLESFFDFGQKFNGITGAFAYLGNRPGWLEIRDMSMIIDDVCRAYTKNPEWKKLEEKHFKIIHEASRNVYMILKFLREVKTPDEAFLQDCKRILEERKAMTEIPERESQSQDEVDALISQISE